MSKQMRRGNDLLFTPNADRDGFDHYHGPLGADVRQSICGPHPDNRDDPGGDGPLEVVRSNKEYKGQQGKPKTNKRY